MGEFASLFEKAKANRRRLDNCPCHKFPVDTVIAFGGKTTCERCKGEIDLIEAYSYVQGYEVAGGYANDIWPNFRDETLPRPKVSAKCPQCQGKGFIIYPTGDHFDCDVCSSVGVLPVELLPPG